MTDFTGCYLLRSQKFKKRCYVGFTVDPPHRIKQHNGDIQGGAFKTHQYRPWDMTLVVHGFPTRKFALQFEWSWQHPTAAHLLSGINWVQVKEDSGSDQYMYHIRILKEMLNIEKWRRLSLHVCATLRDVYDILTDEPLPLPKSQVQLGTLDGLMVAKSPNPTPGCAVPSHCYLCKDNDPPSHPANWVVCPFCGVFLHLRCLSKLFISQTPNARHALIPTRGNCPGCNHLLEWRMLVEIRNRFESNINSQPFVPELTDDEDNDIP